MRIAVISDIHGNLEAFTAVLSDIDRSGVDEIICLGDMIGYGPEPEEVVREIRKRKIPTLMGNHEMAVTRPKELKWFNALARKSLEQTIDMLASDTVDYIAGLEAFFVRHNCRFVHGFPPDSPKTYLFTVSYEGLIGALETMEEPICFVGHTHIPARVSYDGDELDESRLKAGVTPLDGANRYILNVGSVGQPRDGDNRAKYMIWDAENHTAEVKYISYDVASVVDKILKIGLPEDHARRLW